MKYYLDNPAELLGKDIKQYDMTVSIVDRATGDTVAMSELAALPEAKELWVELTNAKFAAGLMNKETKYRQWFSYGTGQQATSQSTGWTKTS